MKLELNEKEAKAVLAMLALGYQIVREDGGVQEKRKDYDSAISKVFGEYLRCMEKVAVTESKIRLSVEEYLDDVEDCLKRYTRNNLLDNIAAALADYKYPVKDYITEVDQYTKNQIAEDMYLRVLTEKGMSAVNIEIADFEEKVNQEFQTQKENIEKVAGLKKEANKKFLKAIVARIYELLAEHHMTVEELSERSGISFPILSEILSGNGEIFEWGMINKICKSFCIDIAQFFADDAFEVVYETAFFKGK
jgi:hypothetical protein